MTEEEIYKKKNDDFYALLERTKQIKSKWEIFSEELDNKNTDKIISERIYAEHFLMSSLLDAFMFRESLNLKELYQITLNDKIPEYLYGKFLLGNLI